MAEMQLVARVRMRGLDAAVSGLRGGRTFGLGQALIGLAIVPGSFLLLIVMILVHPGLSEAAAQATSLALMVAAGSVQMYRVARRCGGFGRALGFRWPSRYDVPRVVGWSLVALMAQAAVVSLLRVWLGVDESPSGVELEAWPTRTATVTLIVFAFVVAPFFEELLFRGLILRGLMLHGVGFWVAAAASSAAFGLGHASALSAGGFASAVGSATFAMLQCTIVRRTGDLAVAIGVHFVTNFLVLVALLV